MQHGPRRALLVPDSGVLFEWGVDMMDTALSARVYQDGLLVAVFASRGRRLRSMALLRVGHELIRRGDHYRIELTPEQVKTDKRDCFDLPAALTPYVRHHLTAVRPALLRGQLHDALWIGHRGEAWAASGIQHHIRVLTRKRFGLSFGPHRFRHAIATTATLRDPAYPGLAAGLLGITGQVVEEHYDRASQSQAAMMFDEAFARRRDRLRGAEARTNRP